MGIFKLKKRQNGVVFIKPFNNFDEWRMHKFKLTRVKNRLRIIDNILKKNGT